MSAHRSRVLPLAFLFACAGPTAPSAPTSSQRATPDIVQAMAAIQAAGLSAEPTAESLRLYVAAAAALVAMGQVQLQETP